MKEGPVQTTYTKATFKAPPYRVFDVTLVAEDGTWSTHTFTAHGITVEGGMLSLGEVVWNDYLNAPFTRFFRCFTPGRWKDYEERPVSLTQGGGTLYQ